LNLKFFGLKSLLRKVALSIASNIFEKIAKNVRTILQARKAL
jgi:hypothetical protein